MLSNSTLPKSPLYDPKSKIKNFNADEDFEYIRSILKGKGYTYTDTKCHYALEDDKEWKRPQQIVTRPQFINGKPDRFDALQGQRGDCWLICAMEAMTFNQQLIDHVVPPDQSFRDHNYIGAFHFRIWRLGVWYDVVVDDRLPVFKKTQKLCYAHSRSGNVFWAALLEKAYAKTSGKTKYYDHLDTGFLMTSFQDFSGGLAERVETARPPPGRPIKWLLNEVYSKRALMGCAYLNKNSPDLKDGHSYSITNIFKCSDNDPDYAGLYIVRVMNPWGFKEWKGDWSDDDFQLWKQIDRKIRERLNFLEREDGEFWMDEQDFEKYFAMIWICHLGPGQYVESCHMTNPGSWATTSFYGEWVKNVSAGGSEVKNRHMNPRYEIELSVLENDINRDVQSIVVIELTQRSKFDRQVKPRIGFYVYSLSDSRVDKLFTLYTQSSSKFFESNDPINKGINFYMSDGRTFLMSFKLATGGYIIVPCTLNKGEESQFLLRVFAESPVQHWEYDTRISKSLLTKDFDENAFDDGLKKLFADAADGQGEVGWIELKEILEITMNQNISTLGVFTSIFNFFWSILAKILSLNHSSNDETGYIVFSKDECRRMIAMLDNDHSGKLNYSEFCNLWRKIRFWCQVYDCYRENQKGYMTVDKLQDALSSLGYNLNKKTIHSLVYFYVNTEGNVILTDFIICGVTLETALSLYQKSHVENEHKIELTLEEWVKNILIV